MASADKRIERMVMVARMYYEQDMTQNEIAKALGISFWVISCSKYIRATITIRSIRLSAEAM